MAKHNVLESQKDDIFLMNQALNSAAMVSDTEKFHVSVSDFDGPLDILLMMAKSQKIDLMKISISKLAEQYLVFVKEAQKLRLELAADYLVMAAWLAFLKSKLLLPVDETPADEMSADELAKFLQYQLARLNAFREKTALLLSLPQLHQDFFARGMIENLHTQTTTDWGDTLYDILMAYGSRKMMNARKIYHVTPPAVMRSEDILKRILPMIDKMNDWRNLKNFLPVTDDMEIVIQKSAYAGTLVACLELAKRGLIEIKQENVFGDIEIRGINIVS